MNDTSELDAFRLGIEYGAARERKSPGDAWTFWDDTSLRATLNGMKRENGMIANSNDNPVSVHLADFPKTKTL